MQEEGGGRGVMTNGSSFHMPTKQTSLVGPFLLLQSRCMAGACEWGFIIEKIFEKIKLSVISVWYDVTDALKVKAHFSYKLEWLVMVLISRKNSMSIYFNSLIESIEFLGSGYATNWQTWVVNMRANGPSGYNIIN